MCMVPGSLWPCLASFLPAEHGPSCCQEAPEAEPCVHRPPPRLLEASLSCVTDTDQHLLSVAPPASRPLCSATRPLGRPLAAEPSPPFCMWAPPVPPLAFPPKEGLTPSNVGPPSVLTPPSGFSLRHSGPCCRALSTVFCLERLVLVGLRLVWGVVGTRGFGAFKSVCGASPRSHCAQRWRVFSCTSSRVMLSPLSGYYKPHTKA